MVVFLMIFCFYCGIVLCAHFQLVFSLIYIISLFSAGAVSLTMLTCAKMLNIWTFELPDLFFGLEHNAHKWTFWRTIEHYSLTSLAHWNHTWFSKKILGIKVISTHAKVRTLSKHLENVIKKQNFALN